MALETDLLDGGEPSTIPTQKNILRPPARHLPAPAKARIIAISGKDLRRAEICDGTSSRDQATRPIGPLAASTLSFSVFAGRLRFSSRRCK